MNKYHNNIELEMRVGSQQTIISQITTTFKNTHKSNLYTFQTYFANVKDVITNF